MRFFLGVCLLACPTTAFAQAFTVTTNADQVLDDAFCSLREALHCFNGATCEDACVAVGTGTPTIIVPPDTYVLGGTAGEDANAGGDLDIIGTGGAQILILSSSSPTTRPTINGAAADRIFDVRGNMQRVELHNLILINGNEMIGGCIRHEGATPAGPGSAAGLRLVGTRLSGCTGEQGGGIHFSSTEHSLALQGNDVNNTVIETSTATTGGAVYAAAFFQATVSNTHILSNDATDAAGIYATGASSPNRSVTISDSLFEGNDATEEAGALYIDATVGITSTTFHDNSAGTQGGAIVFSGAYTASCSRCTFTQNTAQFGGAVLAEYTSMTTTITDSHFASNTAEHGGAVYNTPHPNPDARLTIARASFVGNTATADGGAAYNASDATNQGRLTLLNATFAQNNAVNGGALANSGEAEMLFTTVIGNTASTSGGGVFAGASELTLTRNVVLDNVAPSGPDCFSAASFVSLGGNLMRAAPPGGCALHGMDVTTAATSGTLFAPLAVSSNQPTHSPVSTRATLAQSSAVNAVTCFGQTQDARGVARAQGAACDIGAYESELDIRASISTSSVFTAGAAVSYTIRAENPAGRLIDAAGATLRIVMPAALHFDSLITAPGFTCTAPAMGDSGEISCSASSPLLIDSEAVFTLGAVIDAATVPSSNVSVTATVAATLADRAPADDAAVSSQAVGGVVDLALAIVRTPNSATLTRGAGVSYVVTVTNEDGPSTAVGAQFSDTVSAALENVTQAPGDTFTLAKGATATFTISGNVRTDAVAADGPVGYDASVAAAGYAGGTASGSDTPFAIDDTTAIASALVATIDATEAVAGESMTWTATRGNSGPALSRNVSSTFTADGDIVEALTLAPECDADKDVGDAGPVVVTCTCDGACVAAVGADVVLATITFAMASSSGGNGLLASLDVAGDYDADGATAMETVEVGRESALTVTATVAGGSVTVHVENAGPSDADLVLAFSLPAGFSISPATLSQTLAAGESLDFTFVLSVSDGAAAGEGTATASATGAGSVSATFSLDSAVPAGTGLSGTTGPTTSEEEQAPMITRTGCGCRGSEIDPSVLLVLAVLLLRRKGSV